MREPLVQPQKATLQDRCRGRELDVSAGLSIFNEGVKPSPCEIDPVRLCKEN